MLKRSIITLFLWLLPLYANATKYHGRVTVGSLISKETFREDSAETTNNDFNILSSRLYVDFSEIGDGQYSVITDLRDKHDFFSKLDKEKLELTGQNDFQVRQLYLKYPNHDESFFYNLGRFSPVEAGAVYVDGLQLGYRVLENFSLSAVVGNNPKRDHLTYLEHDSKAINKGITSLYLKKSRNKGSYYYLANSYMIQTYNEEEDRKFWFNNSIIQFDHKHRLTTLFYYDLIPTQKFQNLWVNYWFRTKRRYSMSISASRVDVIEYLRRQDIRETLDSSIYDQYSVNMRSKLNPKMTTELKLQYGIRDSDNLDKKQVQVGFIYHRFLGKNKNAYSFLGKRDNFTTDDTFLRFGIAHFSDKWEYAFDEQVILETDIEGSTDTVSVSEISASHLYSRKLFTTFSLQYAKDKKVDIISTFIKVSYRFGNKEIAPLRDGASPQGKL